MNSYKHANEISYNLTADYLNVLIAKLHHHLQMCALMFLHHFLIPCFVTSAYQHVSSTFQLFKIHTVLINWNAHSYLIILELYVTTA